MRTSGLGLVNPDKDVNRHNTNMHYRLYDHSQDGPVVICVQDFDYPDYDRARFLTYEAYDTKRLAEIALDSFCMLITELASRLGRATER